MKHFDLSGQKVAVVGLGISGLAAVELAIRAGATCTAIDSKTEQALGDIALRVRQTGANLQAAQTDPDLSHFDLVVVSPGVPPLSCLERATQQGVEVIGEVEFAVRGLKPGTPIVAIGGTNGKSTVTSLYGAVAEKVWPRVFVGGNLGEPLAAHAHKDWDLIVLEVSSFQMERVRDFAPRVAVLLNITDDHLDRYPDFAAYAQAKGNAFARQSSSDLAVCISQDEVVEAQASRGAARMVLFGTEGDVRVTREGVLDTRDGAFYQTKDIRLQGLHNLANVAAVVAGARDLGVSSDVLRQVFSSFEGLPHRTSFVRELQGVRYYDDSKGTNVGASVTAVRGLMESRVVLIAGGRDKGGSYAPLMESLRERGRALIAIGEAAELIVDAAEELSLSMPVMRAASMHDAVQLAQRAAEPGDAVLLSPACSSFDMYKSYKERGDDFCAEVRALVDGAES